MTSLASPFMHFYRVFRQQIQWQKWWVCSIRNAVSVILVMLNDNPSVERKLEGYR